VRSRRSSPTLSRSSRSRTRRPTTSAGRTSTSSGLCRRCVYIALKGLVVPLLRFRVRRQLADIGVSASAGYGWWPINVSLGCEASLVLVAFYYVLSGKSRNYLFPRPRTKHKTLSPHPLYFSYFTSRVPTTFSFSPSESHIVFAINDSPISVRFLSVSSSRAAQASGMRRDLRGRRRSRVEVCLSWLAFLRRGYILYRALLWQDA
jgi:hypothetical protein